MNKSLNAQHSEIYKLLGDLNEHWKTLKLKEKNIQSSSSIEYPVPDERLEEEIPFWVRRETWAPLIENLQGSR